jgi:hypothetical protein
LSTGDDDPGAIREYDGSDGDRASENDMAGSEAKEGRNIQVTLQSEGEIRGKKFRKLPVMPLPGC